MLRARGLRWLLALVWLFASYAAFAQHLIGAPPITRFAPDLDVFPQNLAITQDTQGIVYLGNADGVLEFDGERWSLTLLPNREAVRSLDVDADDRIFVGGYNAFGYLERDSSGKSQFIDLTMRFAHILQGREFNDIWSTLVAPEGVYFRALRDVFFWNPVNDEIRHWRHEGRFGAITHHEGVTLLQFRGEGFKRRSDDDWILLPETRSLVNLVGELVPLADGGLLTLGVDGDWWRLHQGTLTRLTMPATMPDASNFENAATLEDGSIAFAAGDGTVYIVDPTRQIEWHFKIDPGWLSGIRRSRDGGFLVSGNLAFYRIPWPAPWSLLGDEHGAVGMLMDLAHWNGSDYLISSAGVFQLQPQPSGVPRFVAMNWGDSDAYSLFEVDSARALFATSHKLLLVEGAKVREVTDELVYPRMFQRSRFRPDRIYVGTETGLRIVHATAEDVALSQLANEGLEMRVSSIAELSANELWFGTHRHGLWHVRLDTSGNIIEQQRYGAEQGLKLGVIPGANVTLLADGTLMAATNLGFFAKVGDQFVPHAMEGLSKLRSGEEILYLVQAENGDLWSYGAYRVFSKKNTGAWIEHPLHQLKRGAINAFNLHADGGASVVAMQSLLLYNGNIHRQESSPPKVSLRAVARVQRDGTEHPLPLRPSVPITLTYGDFGVRFQFALPDLTQASAQMYQGRLQGYEQEFSAWSRARGYTYGRLSPGEYALQVRARDRNGNISEITPYRLVVLPVWYRRWWAYALWTVLAAVALWLVTQKVIRLRTRRLAEDKRALENTVAERTQELAAANRQLEQMAHLDGLTGIANRRRLDEYLRTVWQHARDARKPVAILLIDVDHFKHYNDAHGHLAGDQLLKSIVLRLQQCLRRDGDLLARYGGEEFMAVLPDRDSEHAAALAEEMRREIDRAELGATISIGVASCSPSDEAFAALIEAADRALYFAKHSGRNRVARHGTDGKA